ncbi:MAG: hypothetical protein K2W92_08300 [Alphaproteobacteria bacterium]|nr:hypothetical protein [Alphaproteobacteria bacterium]
MTNIKHQGLAKALFCLSMLLNAGSINADPLDLEGPNFIGPRKPSRPKQDWEDKKPQGQRESYVATHNKIAAKYGFTQHVIDPQASYKGVTLTKAAEDFKHACEILKDTEEERLAEINTLGQAAVHTSKTVAKTLVETNVQEEKTKGIFTLFIDGCAAIAENFFSK